MDVNNKDSDDSQSTTNSASAISYKQLHADDGDQRDHRDAGSRVNDLDDDDDDSSNQSSLDIPTTSDNLRSLPVFLSESTQNLLGNDEDNDDDTDNDLLVERSNGKNQFDKDSQSNTNIIIHKTFGDDDVDPMDTPTHLRPPVCTDKDLVDTESIQSSGTFTHSEENLLMSGLSLEFTTKGEHRKSSSRISVSSETDILRFDIDSSTKRGGDAQSIDSHMFTMLDKDKSLTTLNSDDVAEQTLVGGVGGGEGSEGISLASDDGSSQQRVRFQGMYIRPLFVFNSFTTKDLLLLTLS